MRKLVVVGLAVLLSGCVSERHFVLDNLLPFGNPNAPKAASETAQRALGHSPQLAVIQPQPGDVWPGPVEPMPTLSEIQKNANLPLGQGYTPSLPSPYPPGQEPSQDSTPPMGGSLFAVPAATPTPAGS